ncbi:MAG TPA: hypothetical protein DF292_04570 [Firmicutes bacterium]|jgi:hypothetical protein|nr:hypothetical protein [Bacillota bacterium]
MRDRFVRGIFVGECAGFVMMLVSLILRRLNLTDSHILQKGAFIFISRAESTQPLGLVLGLCAHISFSAMFGIGFQLLLWVFGNDYLFIKGVSYSIFIWVSFGILSHIMDINDLLSPNTASALGWLFSHLIYGLGLAATTWWLDRKAAAARAGE